MVWDQGFCLNSRRISRYVLISLLGNVWEKRMLSAYYETTQDTSFTNGACFSSLVLEWKQHKFQLKLKRKNIGAHCILCIYTQMET